MTHLDVAAPRSVANKTHGKARRLVGLVGCLAWGGLSLGCGDDSTEPATPVVGATSPWEEGPYPAGQTTLTLTDAARSRTLQVELWYPADLGVQAAADEGAPLSSFESDSGNAARVDELLEAAPAGCPSTRTHALRGAAVGTSDARPLIVFSHCLSCGRYSSFSVAEHLARHGFVVAAPDHDGSVRFDPDTDAEPLDSAQLDVRVADQRFVLDSLLAADAPLPAGLQLDPERVGALGHSFGSVTTGKLIQDDSRVKAAAGLAAPMQNPLLPGVDVTQIDRPLMFLLAEEDNSVQEIGNNFIRDNHDKAGGTSTLVSVADAGHWSVSDVCGLVDAFVAGCGMSTRHSSAGAGESFDYLPVNDGIDITRRYVASFFFAELLGDSDAATYLKTGTPAALVTVSNR